MKESCGVVVLFLLLLPSLPAQAQDIELTTYTAEQRWERASSQVAVSWVAAIAYAKSMGQTADDYAHSVVEVFTPGWGEAGTGTLSVINGMNRNYMMFTGSEFELVDQSETSVTARNNRPWTTYFGDDGVWYGVSLEELERVFQIFNQGLADYLGLGYREWVEDGWAYMEFSLK